MVAMLMGKRLKKKGFTLIEMQVGMVVLLILFLMTAGIELFLLQSTMRFVKTADQDPEIASVLNHMDRNLAQGEKWQRFQNGAVTDIEFFVPDPAAPSDRTRDINMRYRIDVTPDANGQVTNGSVTFFPNATTGVPPPVLLIQNLSSVFVSNQDANARELYVELQNARSALQYRENGTTLGRTMRLRGVW